MEVNPGNVDVRMTVAYEISQTGDAVSAYRLLEPVVAENRDNADFQKFLFSTATQAGQKAMAAADSTTGREILGAALNAYQAAFGTGDVDAPNLRQAIAVNNALGQDAEALRLAQDATQRFPDDAGMWDQLARVHSQAGRYPEAIEALGRVIAIDPNFENAYLRRAQAHLQAGQRSQALPDLERAAAAGSRETVAQLLYAEGGRAANARNYGDAEQVLELAMEYASGELRGTIAYVRAQVLLAHGHSIAQPNSQLRNPNRGEIERALGIFREALAVVGQAGSDPRGIRGQIEQYITNQEALLQSLR
jgi:tetratricopeptide (TPR) repeat protein